MTLLNAQGLRALVQTTPDTDESGNRCQKCNRKRNRTWIIETEDFWIDACKACILSIANARETESES